MEGKQVLLYSDAAQEGLAIRWRQQLNENAKLLCSHHVFPEMNHNELVGWETGDERYVALMIQTPEDHERTRIRMEVCMEIFQQQGADVVVVEGDGDDTVLRFFDLVHVGDWLSLVLAERAGVDPVDIKNIDHLKNALAQIPLTVQPQVHFHNLGHQAYEPVWRQQETLLKAAVSLKIARRKAGLEGADRSDD